MKVTPAATHDDGSASRIVTLEHDGDSLIVAKKRQHFGEGRDQELRDSWRVKVVDGVLVVEGSGSVTVKR